MTMATFSFRICRSHDAHAFGQALPTPSLWCSAKTTEGSTALPTCARPTPLLHMTHNTVNLDLLVLCHVALARQPTVLHDPALRAQMLGELAVVRDEYDAA